MFWCLDHKVCGLLVPCQKIEPTLPALEGRVTWQLDHQGSPKHYSIQLREHLCVPSIILGREGYKINKTLASRSKRLTGSRLLSFNEVSMMKGLSKSSVTILYQLSQSYWDDQDLKWQGSAQRRQLG